MVPRLPTGRRWEREKTGLTLTFAFRTGRAPSPPVPLLGSDCHQRAQPGPAPRRSRRCRTPPVPPGEPSSTCISELEWSATEGDSRPALHTGSGTRRPPASGLRGGAGQGVGAGLEPGTRSRGGGSSGPRRAVLARRGQRGAGSRHRPRPPRPRPGLFTWPA